MLETEGPPLPCCTSWLCAPPPQASGWIRLSLAAFLHLIGFCLGVPALSASLVLSHPSGCPFLSLPPPLSSSPPLSCRNLISQNSRQPCGARIQLICLGTVDVLGTGQAWEGCALVGISGECCQFPLVSWGSLLPPPHRDQTASSPGSCRWQSDQGSLSQLAQEPDWRLLGAMEGSGRAWSASLQTARS